MSGTMIGVHRRDPVKHIRNHSTSDENQASHIQHTLTERRRGVRDVCRDIKKSCLRQGAQSPYSQSGKQDHVEGVGFDSRSVQELSVMEIILTSLRIVYLDDDDDDGPPTYPWSSCLSHDIHMQNGYCQRKLLVNNCGSAHRTLG